MTKYDPDKMRELQKHRADILANVKTVVEGAKDAGRELTASENAVVEEAMARVKDVDALLREQSKMMVDSVIKLGSSETVYGGGGSLFDEQAKQGIVTAIKSKTAYRFEVPRKALTSGTLLPTAGTGVEGGLHPNLFSVASLFRSEPASGPTVRYYRLDNASADIVTEGAAKPDSLLPPDPPSVPPTPSSHIRARDAATLAGGVVAAGGPDEPPARG